MLEEVLRECGASFKLLSDFDNKANCLEMLRV